MKNGDKHIVLRTVLDLEYHGNADALALQKMIAGWSAHGLLDALERTLDRVVPKDRILKIDTLELEISVQESADWLEKLQEQVAVQLSRRLTEISYEEKAASEEIRHQSPEENFVAAFVFFLQQGSWPWWSPVRTQQDLFEGLGTVLRPEMQENLKRSIRETITQPSPKQRVLWQMPEPLFYRLLMVLRPEITTWLLPAREEIERVGSRLPATGEKAWKISWKRFLLEEPGETANRTVRETMNRFVASVTEHKDEVLLLLVRSIPLAPVLQQAIEEQVGQKGIMEIGAGQITGTIPAMDQGQEPADRKEKAIPKEWTTEPAAEGDGIYINNAGLVIIAGFLPMLFRKLGLTDEQSAITNKNRAAALVQYLASGRDEIAEFELGLARVLCGIEGTEPVDTTLLLTVAEIKEVNELLLSAIEYWSVLKDTSVAGFRESFLLREGKLSFRDDEWFLQVKQQPYDMLLQNLPWNISMIRLPWMPHLLKTEWIF